MLERLLLRHASLVNESEALSFVHKCRETQAALLDVSLEVSELPEIGLEFDYGLIW